MIGYVQRWRAISWEVNINLTSPIHTFCFLSISEECKVVRCMEAWTEASLSLPREREQDISSRLISEACGLLVPAVKRWRLRGGDDLSTGIG